MKHPHAVLASNDPQAIFRANGSTDPDDDAYQTFAQSGFKDWRLLVDGLVKLPVQLSLGELRALPARTQITRIVKEQPLRVTWRRPPAEPK